MPAIDYDPQEQNLVKILDKRILILLSLIYFSARLQSDTMSDMRIEIFAAKNWTSQGVSGILGKNSTSKAESLLENDFSSVEFNRWIHFFFGLGYMLACFPSCFAARFVQPSRWFSFLLCCSAFIGLITPHASDFGGIATLQFFSGVVLAGILPGIIVYISNFYIKEEYGIRYAGILILGDQFASIFGTLLAGAVGLLVEKSAWKWVLGVGTFISIIISIFSWLYLPNSTRYCYFLTPADRVLAKQRVKDSDDPDPELEEISSTRIGVNTISKDEEPFIFHQNQLNDWAREYKFHVFGLSIFFLSMSTGIILARSPLIAVNVQAHTHQWYNEASLFLSEFPKVIACVFALILSQQSDKKGERAIHATIPILIASFGLFTMAFIGDPIYRFIVTLIIPALLWSSFPLIISYAIDHSHGDTTVILVSAGSVFLYPFGESIVRLGYPLLDSSPSGYYSPTVQKVSGVPLDLGIYIVASLAAFACALCVLGIRWMHRRVDQNAWSRAPGLRRLLNDDQEDKVWGTEGSFADLLSSPTSKIAKTNTTKNESIPLTSGPKKKTVKDELEDDDADWN